MPKLAKPRIQGGGSLSLFSMLLGHFVLARIRSWGFFYQRLLDFMGKRWM
jgi:hypothetical protein